MKRSFIWVLFFAVLIFQIALNPPKSTIQNYLNLRLIKSWLSIQPMGLQSSGALRDDIPDHWNIQVWGGARAFYNTNAEIQYSGERALFIHRTNTLGGAALIQDVSIPPSTRMDFSVYAKGAEGAIQIWLGNQQTGEWIKDAGWLNIPPTDTWEKFTLSLDVPSNTNLARFWLRAVGNGITGFDNAFTGTEEDMVSGTNLIRNPGFEKDGYTGDPLMWWQNHINQVLATNIPKNTQTDHLSYQNIYDMLNGNFALIQERAKQLGSNCAQTPEMTSWLLSKADDFEKAGGVAAREQIYQLAIQLAPSCPQPYAALARLIAQNNSNWMAAELYKQAAYLAEDTLLSGRYSFEEGSLRLRYTGELDLASVAFQKAIEKNGWEASIWHQGAALFFLGQTLEQQGKLEESIAIYNRVLECSYCTYYHEDARNKIATLTSTLH